MTTTRMQTTTLAAILLAGVLALSACGGDDETTTSIGSEGGVVTSAPTTDDATTAPADPTSSPATTQGGGADAVPSPFRDDEAELDVEDQAGDGSTVVVEEVRLTRADGFVAIFAEDGETLLGHAPVARSGEERRFDVPLDQPLSGTRPLVAVLYADDGDGAFDAQADPRVTDDDDDDNDDDIKTDRFTYRVQ